MDPCVSLLLLPGTSATARTLLIADENTLQAIEHLPDGAEFQLLTNRYDVLLKGRARQIPCHYSDFDFGVFKQQSFDRVLYRVSKERAVSNHIINNAFALLKQDGELVLSGAKNEGIKNYTGNAAKLFGTKARSEKHGQVYRSRIVKTAATAQQQLDSKDYPALRPIIETSDLTILSKPGVFGWNKIDQGSQLLVNTAQGYLSDNQLTPHSLLDLGCGYGYITLQTKNWPSLNERWATDNNAAAIECVRANAEANALNIEVVADDCATHIDKRFDLILCNPPFHQGFETDQSLTVKFLEQTRRHLNPEGVALFVVNQFIAIPKLAETRFSACREIENDGSFKVYALLP